MATSKEAKSKINDVAKPGSTAPDASARPIIMDRKPAIKQDPMIAEDEEKPAEEQPELSKTGSSSRKVIAPITMEEKSEPAEKALPEDKAEESAAAPPETDDAAVVEAVADQTADKKKEAAAAEADQKKQEAIQQLIQEKTYFLPIKTAKAKRNSRLGATVLVLLLLAIVGGYAAIDAGLIKTSISLPVHFFKK